MSDIAFCTGLPRSGSTLLMNLLAQNPTISAGPTSPLPEIVYQMRQAVQGSMTYKAGESGDFVDRWQAMVTQSIQGWASTGGAELYVDKSRMWLNWYPFLQELGMTKVIVCVRDLRGILASLERRRREDGLFLDPTEQGASGNGITVQDRIRLWMEGIVGNPLNRIIDAVQSGYLKDYHIVRMEDLCEDPTKTMFALYEYLERPAMTHNFDCIEQTTFENDLVHGMRNLHTVAEKLKPVREDWADILPTQVCSQIKSDNRWFYQTFYSDRRD